MMGTDVYHVMIIIKILKKSILMDLFSISATVK